MNRILVTGSTGNVGRHVVDQLTAAGAQFRAMTRDPDPRRRPYHRALQHSDEAFDDSPLVIAAKGLGSAESIESASK
jgi:uncharacterized protein YbjT (DUF2867 family)